MIRAIELLDQLQRSGEIANPRVAQLQKVLQSEFFNSVRQVYEHIYETVEIEGATPEV